MATSLVKAGLLFTIAGLGHAQTFEVASIRPSPPPGATLRTPVPVELLIVDRIVKPTENQ